MKCIYAPVTLLLSLLMMSGCSHSPNEFPVLEGSYLGQNPPGLMPEVFAPGIISTKGWEIGGVFTPDMNEFYFIREVEVEGKLKQEFVVFRNKNNQWRESVLGPRMGEAFISPDGNTMHLGRRYKERTKTGWSKRKNLGAPFEDIRIMRLTASSKDTYVFDEMGAGVIRYSRLVGGKHEAPKLFSKEINTGQFNAHPFIAPDESYLIWDGQRDSVVRNADLYISFRQKDGSWGEAIKMGDTINTSASESGASVTPDGKYLFFKRKTRTNDVDIFWVDAQIIENLRPKP